MTASLGVFSGVVPFVATAQARSFREAARQLGVTASAVSKAIAKLEADLGVRLLHRTSRRVTLTTEGEDFLERCRDAVDRVAAARDLVSESQRAPRGLLRVSLPHALGRIVMAALPRLLTRHPALTLHAMLTDRFVQLTEENVDVAVRIGTVEDSRAVGRRLRTLRWVTVASPAYLARNGTPQTPADLVRHNCLKFVLGTGLAQEWVFRTGSTAVTTRLQGTLTADHGESLVAAAIAGLGVLQAPDLLVAGELSRGELLEILRPYASPGPALTVLSAPGRHRAPKVRAFVSFMTELVAA